MAFGIGIRYMAGEIFGSGSCIRRLRVCCPVISMRLRSGPVDDHQGLRIQVVASIHGTWIAGSCMHYLQTCYLLSSFEYRLSCNRLIPCDPLQVFLSNRVVRCLLVGSLLLSLMKSKLRACFGKHFHIAVPCHLWLCTLGSMYYTYSSESRLFVCNLYR